MPTLPMSCSGARRCEQIDALGRQVVVVIGMVRELLREDSRVLLRATGMLSRLCVLDLGQRQQRLHHQPLGRVFLDAGEYPRDGARASALPRSRRRVRPRDRASERAAKGRCRQFAMTVTDPAQTAATDTMAASAPHASPARAPRSVAAIPSASTANVSTATPFSGAE